MDAKARLRADAKSRRAGLRDGKATSALADRLLGFFESRDEHVIGGYWPIGSEIDVRPALQGLADAGCRIALPVLVAPDAALIFRRWRPGDTLNNGPHGTSEPTAVAEAARPSALLVPLLAFDNTGGRIGYGGGYYDRTLAGLRKDGHICAIGIAYAGQEIDRVPVTSTDQKLDWVVTECEVRRCGEEQ